MPSFSPLLDCDGSPGSLWFTYGKYEWECFSILRSLCHWLLELGLDHLLFSWKRRSVVENKTSLVCIRSY